MASESHVIYARTERATSAALAKDRFIRLASGRVALSSANAIPHGVSLGAIAASTAQGNQMLSVGMIGVMTVEASSTGAIAFGARVGVAANGKAKTAAATGAYAGIALSTFAATEVGPILFTPTYSS